MSKVKIAGHASGSGTLTIQAPDTSSSRTITLPDADVTLGAATPSITDDGNSAITIQNGAIGIGVTPEAWNASYEAIQLGSKGFIWDVGDEFFVGSNAHFDSAWKYTTTSEASQIKQVDGRLVFANAASGSADAAITFTDRFEITADGRGLSQFTAKAWANVDQGGQTLQDSHNISSISDEGVGKTQVNFDVDLANANYAIATSSEANSMQGTQNQGASSVQIYIVNSAASYEDRDDVCMVVFGD